MQKWEYLELTIGSTSFANNFKFEYSLNGERVEEKVEGNPSDRPSTWKLMNKLGNQGWELVSVNWQIHYYWFKRPKNTF